MFRRSAPPFLRLTSMTAALSNRRRLATLPEHRLEDVGLSREEAIAEAARPVWECRRTRQASGPSEASAPR
jgi:uncharacterized protein YjiS (DUF1127 family)